MYAYPLYATAELAPVGGYVSVRPFRGTLADGLYRVSTSYLCAGFVVRGGVVVECAPVLAKRIGYWATVAQWVGP